MLKVMSTLCGCVQRGAILLDGVPVPHIQHEWLHSQVKILSTAAVGLYAEACSISVTCF